MGEVVALEGATFTGFCNFALIVVVVVTAVRREPLSWALVRQLLVLALSVVAMFFLCMGVVAFTGLP